MCTSLAFSQHGLFGRNLDLEYSFGQSVVVTGRRHAFHFHHRSALQEHYAIIGMANVAQNEPLYAEACNEKGLYLAGLNFPGNAFYFPTPSPQKENLAPHELFWLILGSCENLSQARALLEQVQLVAEPFAENLPLAPLHWHIADSTGALVAEPTAQGLQIWEDPVGVLTNNPPFSYQLTRLCDFQALSPCQPKNQFAPAVTLHSYGQGMGAMGLPGDWSPSSRFVRAAFLKAHASFCQDERDLKISQFFHILDAVAMVRGAVVTPEGREDETIYSSCLDTQRLLYCYKTYHNSTLQAVSLKNTPLDTSELSVFALKDKPCIQLANA